MVAIRRGRAWSTPLLILVLGVLTVSAGVGAYFDWIWWHPTKGIVVTMVAIGALLVGGLANWLAPGPMKRMGLALLAVGIGLLLGQLLGPQREPVLVVDGDVTLRLSSPITAVVSGPASCSTVPSGEHLQVSGDPNLRLPIDGEAAERRPFVTVYAAVGDMWAPDVGHRPDELAVHVAAGAAVEIGDSGPGETIWRSTPDSELVMTGSTGSGSMTFRDLEQTNGVEGSVIPAGELVGMIEWEC